MKTLETLTNLQLEVKSAQTNTPEGRQLVANSCKKLYNTIEDGLYEKYGEDAILDAYNDLCRGDFSEPFHCEKKKEKFELYLNIFINNILEKIEIEEVEENYDVVFNDESDSNNKGFELTLKECKHYIESFNGTNESYFEDYKCGTVSVISNKTGELEFETEIN